MYGSWTKSNSFVLKTKYINIYVPEKTPHLPSNEIEHKKIMSDRRNNILHTQIIKNREASIFYIHLHFYFWNFYIYFLFIERVFVVAIQSNQQRNDRFNGSDRRHVSLCFLPSPRAITTICIIINRSNKRNLLKRSRDRE